MQTTKNCRGIIAALGVGVLGLLLLLCLSRFSSRAPNEHQGNNHIEIVSASVPSPSLQPSSQSSVYYVSSSGSDSNSGSTSTPFKTLNHGVKLLHPGDTLYVRQGTYSEALLDAIPGGTSWSAPVTVAAYPGESVILRPARDDGWVLHFSRSASQFITVSGLILDASNVTYDAVKITDDWNGSTGSAAGHIRLAKCEIRNVRPGTHMGILITANVAAGLSSDCNELVNCKIHDIGGVSGDGNLQEAVYIQSSQNLVDGCEIYNASSYGVQVYSGSLRTDGSVCSGNTIGNCRIYSNDLGCESGSFAVLLGMGQNNLVYNNLIWANRGGIKVHYGATDTLLCNNTIYKNAGAPGISVGNATGTIIRNNILYKNASGIRDPGQGTIADHNTDNSADPMFVNAGVRPPDLHVRVGSLAIDAGIAVSQVTTDCDGVSRPQGRGYDIGAYEYSGSR